MTNYDLDAIKRTERVERFDHAINCMDISTISMMAFERIAEKKEVSLTRLLETLLLDALDRELSKDDKQLEFSFMEGRYG